MRRASGSSQRESGGVKKRADGLSVCDSASADMVECFGHAQGDGLDELVGVESAFAGSNS